MRNTYLQISLSRNFCTISAKESGPVVVVLPGCAIAVMEEKTDSRTGSVHPGSSQSSIKKAATAYVLAGGMVSTLYRVDVHTHRPSDSKTQCISIG
jgi:hypothetical protein